MKKDVLFKCTLLPCILLMLGCKSTQTTQNAPIPQDLPITTQQHLQAVEHWSNIAQDMVNQTVIALEKHKLFNVPLYIKHPPAKSEFAVAFHDFLIDGLLKKGIKVNRENANNTVLEYKVQSIEFNSDRNFPSYSKFGDEYVLANGLVVRRNVTEPNSNITQKQSSDSGGYSWNNRAPKLELLISSAIVDKNIYLMKTADIYYANESDKGLYQGKRHGAEIRNPVFDDAFYHQ